MPAQIKAADSYNKDKKGSITINLDDVKQLLKNSKGIVLYDDITKDIYPIATVANGTDNVYVGRLRRDFSQPNTLNMWCVADNIRKGAASNAIQIMQKIIEKEV